MKYVLKPEDIQGIPSFSPPHHTKTKDRKLIDETIGAQHFALWHGEVEPGGVAELHLHEEMEQAFVVLEGEALFKIGSSEHRLGKGGIAFVPARVTHQITAVGSKTLKILIIMAPPPASMAAWKKQ